MGVEELLNLTSTDPGGKHIFGYMEEGIPAWLALRPDRQLILLYSGRGCVVKHGLELVYNLED